MRKRFSLLQTIEGINFGIVRMYVAPYRISWIIFTLDLVIDLEQTKCWYSDGYKVCSSCSRFVFVLLIMIKPISLRHLTQPLDI